MTSHSTLKYKILKALYWDNCDLAQICIEDHNCLMVGLIPGSGRVFSIWRGAMILLKFTSTAIDTFAIKPHFLSGQFDINP